MCETHGETHSPPETLEGSFSAVSTPMFASKYAFFSIFRELHDYKPSHRFILLFADFFKLSQKKNVNFRDVCKIMLISLLICYFSPKFLRIFVGISQYTSNFDGIDVAFFKITEL